jgi:hypothetical protein
MVAENQVYLLRGFAFSLLSDLLSLHQGIYAAGLAGGYTAVRAVLLWGVRMRVLLVLIFLFLPLWLRVIMDVLLLAGAVRVSQKRFAEKKGRCF